MKACWQFLRRRLWEARYYLLNDGPPPPDESETGDCDEDSEQAVEPKTPLTPEEYRHYVAVAAFFLWQDSLFSRDSDGLKPISTPEYDWGRAVQQIAERYIVVAPEAG